MLHKHMNESLPTDSTVLEYPLDKKFSSEKEIDEYFDTLQILQTQGKLYQVNQRRMETSTLEWHKKQAIHDFRIKHIEESPMFKEQPEPSKVCISYESKEEGRIFSTEEEIEEYFQPLAKQALGLNGLDVFNEIHNKRLATLHAFRLKQYNSVC